jgi:hypothetical protein
MTINLLHERCNSMTKFTDLSRRDLLITAAGLASGAIARSAVGAPVNDRAGDLDARRRAVRHLRVSLAEYYSGRPLRHHPTNGDEEDFPDQRGLPTYIGNYSKGLPHNGAGEVDYAAYQVLLNALKSGDPQLFELIPLGGVPNEAKRGNRLVAFAALQPKKEQRFYRIHSERALLSSGSPQMRLTDPQSGLAFDLEGADSHELVMPPPPGFRSQEIIAEIAESYWMALTRDVPFLQYETNPDVAAAAKNLSDYSQLKAPKEGKDVTAKTVFRGFAAGELVGPYVSQFLVRHIPFGAYQLPQKVVFGYKPNMKGERAFLITEATWLAAQRGIASNDPSDQVVRIDTPKYIYRGRDLANFVHIDELFQAYLNAALILSAGPDRGGLGAPHDEGNPYDGFVSKEPGLDGSTKINVRVSTQAGFGTLGEPNIASLVAEVATRALKTVWYQKWFVHRRLRPEAYAGRIHFHKRGIGDNKRDYPFDPDEFAKLDPVLKAVAAFNTMKGGDGLFLPMAFAEGCPTHPAYGAGHATVAAACVTILKAFYYEDVSLKDLNASIFIPKEDGTDLVELTKGKSYGPYKYDDIADKMTIGGELNKLASNVSLGRNFAGVHWRSDHAESLRLGEQVAIHLLREIVQTYNERVSFTITKFDGTKTVLGTT